MYRSILLLLCVVSVGCASNAGLGSEPGASYTLVLEGIGPNTRGEFEETLTRFREYRTHKIVSESNERAKYRYVLALTPAELRDSLEAIVARLELNASLRYNNNKQFEIMSQ